MADQYRCDKCNQQFPDQDQFQRHMQQQHQGMGGQQGGQQQQADDGGSRERQ